MVPFIGRVSTLPFRTFKNLSGDEHKHEIHLKANMPKMEQGLSFLNSHRYFEDYFENAREGMSHISKENITFMNIILHLFNCFYIVFLEKQDLKNGVCIDFSKASLVFFSISIIFYLTY